MIPLGLVQDLAHWVHTESWQWQASFIWEKSAYLVEVSVTEQILRKISKFPEILGELRESMRKQCVPGSANALEPGNEANLHDDLKDKHHSD